MQLISSRSRREKVFGNPQGAALDRNAKARIVVYARAWSARHKRKRQHTGPLTRTTIRVLVTLLEFHWDGRCFPKYETIAERAACHRDTVHVAIHALERSGVLTWAHRLMRVDYWEAAFGCRMTRILRRSNSYTLVDPAPKPPAERATNFPTGTTLKVFSSMNLLSSVEPKTSVKAPDPNDPLELACARGKALALAREATVRA